MNAPYRGSLRIFDGGIAGPVHAPPVPDIGHVLAGPHRLARLADELYASEAMNRARGMTNAMQGAEPYTLQWFLNAEQHRYRRHGRWIPRLLEFAKHSGEIMLGLGSGLGTDWVQYARHGAQVVVCSPSHDQLSLVQRNFELRGLSARILHATAASLPLPSASVDVVCLNELGIPGSDLERAMEEAYRVLKPGGKVLAVTPAHYDVDFWARRTILWQWWPRRNSNPADRSRTRFTRRSLKRLFCQFAEAKVYKRQLRRSEIPHLWRWVPLSALERLMGRVLVYKAFKPLSSAIAVREAA